MILRKNDSICAYKFADIFFRNFFKTKIFNFTSILTRESLFLFSTDNLWIQRKNYDNFHCLQIKPIYDEKKKKKNKQSYKHD